MEENDDPLYIHMILDEAIFGNMNVSNYMRH